MSMRGEMSKFNLKNVLKNTLANEGGIKAIYKGASTAMIGVVVYKGVGFASYEYLNQQAQGSINKWVNHFLSGAGGGLIGQISNFFLNSLLSF